MREETRVIGRYMKENERTKGRKRKRMKEGEGE